jgi:riboflavin kinase/FMN adenylyltransferase
VVLTFYPHPSVVLHGRRPSFYLTSPEEKVELLGELGVDVVITHPFTLELSQFKAAEFLDLLQSNIDVRSLWVGPDFALGHEREGSIHFLRTESDHRGFELHVVEPNRISGEVVSSTRIREALRSGDVARAATYLGRPFSIPGRVQDQVEKAGIVTAEVGVWEERAYPGEGLYACLVDGGTGRRKALVLTGPEVAPDVGKSQPLTVHFLDSTHLAERIEVEIHFHDRVRRDGVPTHDPKNPTTLSRELHRARRILDGIA